MKRRFRQIFRLFRPRNLLLAGLAGILVFLILDASFPLPAEKPYSQQILARDSTLLNAYLTPDEKWRMKTHLNEVPDELVTALMAKEDRWFWYHPGINPIAILRAAWSNLVNGRRMSGASTITMQLARMMEPKARTWTGKLKEAFRALQLEWHYSKREILELYLSYLPYGGNVEGVAAASYLYFDRPPARLSLAQCVLLTVIPNRPNSLRPDLHPEAARKARDRWLSRFSTAKCFPPSDLAIAQAEPLPAQRYGMQPEAPQFCEAIRHRVADTRVRTTLDLGKQRIAQRLLRKHIEHLRTQDIHNGAVLVLDNRSQEVLVYCASADFNDKAAQGEVNAITAVRAPGSTLKPLLYAQAFDLGQLSPQRKVKDLPSDFAGYSPVNYDRQFRGEVTVAHALSNSLNVPAVRALQQVGLSPFVQKLEAAGFRHLASHLDDLGLSLALGGCGASLEELVRLYSAFAQGGLQRPLQYLADTPPSAKSVQVCSPEAAFLLADILSGIERPDLPLDLIDRTKLPKIAWKTGTSFGRRDAWAMGFNPNYTIGVWIGNMDGRSVPVMSGGRTAVPLLVNLFNALDFDAEKRWFSPPAGLVPTEVCAATGLLPVAHCHHRVQDWYIAGVTPHTSCDRYREIFTDSAMTVQYCTMCLPPTGYRRIHLPVHDAELLQWYAQQAIQIDRPPQHNPACEGVFYTPGPRITSPEPADAYLVDAGQEILLQAQAQPDAATHYWFVNEEFLGAAPAGKHFFYIPSPGQQNIACMDDKGRLEQMQVMVEIY